MKLLTIIAIITFIATFITGVFIFRGIYFSKDSLTKEQVFLIEKGQSAFQIAENLEKEGLIKDRFFFDFYVFFRGWRLKLQSGMYKLTPAMNIPEIAKKIVSGDIAKEKLTIIEGWNLRDIGLYFVQKEMFTSEELFELAKKDFSKDFSFLNDKQKNASLEGYFFPDTYEIVLGTSLEDVIKKILTNFDKKLTPDLRKEIAKQNKSIFKIVTMASLLEKEVRTFEDKELVAGILWKRLAARIPLQVDATIAYLTGKKTTEILKEEIGINSPYNTYRYLGLPAGPIANPGLESIRAALYPKNSAYWYYLSTPEGETKFSQTLREHNLNRSKYLK